jgi:hypothetical protein
LKYARLGKTNIAYSLSYTEARPKKINDMSIKWELFEVETSGRKEGKRRR